MNLFSRYIEINIYTSREFVDTGALIKINSNAMDISFDVTKTNTDENNKGEIEIYNLSSDIVEAIKISRPATLVLKAGYAGEELKNNIYVGDILEVKTDRDGGDIKTTLTVATSLSATRSLAVSKSWGKNTTLTELITYVMQMESLSLKQPTRYKEHVWKRGVTLSTNLIESLKKIVRNLGMFISIDDNEIDIWTMDNANKVEVVIINSNTGLIGIPEAIADINEERDVTKKEKVSSDNPNDLDNKKENMITDGYKVTTLLNSRIVPTSRISLTSERVKAVNSLMSVDSVRHFGSNFDKEFYSEAVCYEIKG